MRFSLSVGAASGADFWICLEEIVLRFYRREGRQVGLGSEAGPHVVGDQVEDRHCEKPENQLNRLKYDLVGVEGGIDLIFASVGLATKAVVR